MMIMVRTFTGKSGSYSQVGVRRRLRLFKRECERVPYPYGVPFHSRGKYQKIKIFGT